MSIESDYMKKIDDVLYDIKRSMDLIGTLSQRLADYSEKRIDELMDDNVDLQHELSENKAPCT